jgi:hypothetical protein
VNNTLEKEYAECLPKKHAPVAHHASSGGAGVSRARQRLFESGQCRRKSTPATANFSFARTAMAMAAGLALPTG